MNLWNFIRRLSSHGWIFELYLHSMRCGATKEQQTAEKVSKELIEVFHGLSRRRAHLNATCWPHPQADAEPFLEKNFGNTFHARITHIFVYFFSFVVQRRVADHSIWRNDVVAKKKKKIDDLWLKSTTFNVIDAICQCAAQKQTSGTWVFIETRWNYWLYFFQLQSIAWDELRTTYVVVAHCYNRDTLHSAFCFLRIINTCRNRNRCI